MGILVTMKLKVLIVCVIGCYWHGHQCQLRENDEEHNTLMAKRYEETQLMMNRLEQRGITVNRKWECEFRKDKQRDANLLQHVESYLPRFFQNTRYKPISKEKILQAVEDEDFFGFIECSLRVPETWKEGGFQHDLAPREYFHEMSPFFGNALIPFEDIGPHMQEYVRQQQFNKQRERGIPEESLKFTTPPPRKLLIGAMQAENILVFSPLLKWYMEHGIEVTAVHEAVCFSRSACFRKFCEEVSDSRRKGDVDSSETVMADTMKLLGE